MCANQGPRIPGLICKRTRRCCRRTRRRWTCTRRIARTCGCIWWRGRRWIPTDWTQQRQESFRICRQASRISNLQGWNRRKIYSAQATLCTRRRKPGKLKFTSMYSLLLLLQLEGNLLTEREREREGYPSKFGGDRNVRHVEWARFEVPFVAFLHRPFWIGLFCLYRYFHGYIVYPASRIR